MKKTYLIVAILLVAIAGAGYYVYSKGASTTAETTTTSPQVEKSPEQPDQTSTKTEEVPPKAGAYTDYSPDKVATTTETKVLFFHAPWCPQCRELDESIRTETIPQDTTIFKVDYDSNQALRQKYGVTLQTTFVKIDANGEKVADYVAYQSPTFANVKAALLE